MLRKLEWQSISSINRGRLTNQVEHLICRGSIKLKLIIPYIDGVDAIVALARCRRTSDAGLQSITFILMAYRIIIVSADTRLSDIYLIKLGI
jgi:hypothetical protein